MAGLMRSIRKQLGRLFADAPLETPLRKRPLQERDGSSFMYAPSPDFDYLMAQYAWREWISTAVNRMAEMAISSPIIVQTRGGGKTIDDHPFLEMLGLYGQPNESQDSLEFLEQHFQSLDIFGNSFWYWEASHGMGGAPDRVYRLEPERMNIVPGRRRTIDKYVYKLNGDEHDLDPAEITHFRRANVLRSGNYWGLSAIDLIRNTIENDKQMTHWSINGFKTGAPSGILIVDADMVSAEEQMRIEHDLHQQAENKRRTIVIRAKPGSAVWNDAMLKARDMEFREGRLLTRQACFDAFGFHTGLLSEASTEAHARIAKRYVLESVWSRHIRTASVINPLLQFWENSSGLEVLFKDIRQVDWEQESKKLKAVEPYMTKNEVRNEFLHLPKIDERLLNGEGTGIGGADGGRGSDDEPSAETGATNPDTATATQESDG